MQTFVRTSLFSIFATAAMACSAHGQVAIVAPPPPEATIVVGTPPPPPPPPPPPTAVHPAYLHALTDLRNARFNLIRKGGDRNMKWDEAVAIGAIDRAMADIRAAAIDDGKNLDDH